MANWKVTIRKKNQKSFNFLGKYCKGLSPRRVDSEAAKAGAKYEPIAKAQLKKVTKLWQQEVSVTFWESIEKASLMKENVWEWPKALKDLFLSHMRKFEKLIRLENRRKQIY